MSGPFSVTNSVQLIQRMLPLLPCSNQVGRMDGVERFITYLNRVVDLDTVCEVCSDVLSSNLKKVCNLNKNILDWWRGVAQALDIYPNLQISLLTAIVVVHLVLVSSAVMMASTLLQSPFFMSSISSCICIRTSGLFL